MGEQLCSEPFPRRFSSSEDSLELPLWKLELCYNFLEARQQLCINDAEVVFSYCCIWWRRKRNL